MSKRIKRQKNKKNNLLYGWKRSELYMLSYQSEVNLDRLFIKRNEKFITIMGSRKSQIFSTNRFGNKNRLHTWPVKRYKSEFRPLKDTTLPNFEKEIWVSPKELSNYEQSVNE